MRTYANGFLGRLYQRTKNIVGAGEKVLKGKTGNVQNFWKYLDEHWDTRSPGAKTEIINKCREYALDPEVGWVSLFTAALRRYYEAKIQSTHVTNIVNEKKERLQRFVTAVAFIDFISSVEISRFGDYDHRHKTYEDFKSSVRIYEGNEDLNILRNQAIYHSESVDRKLFSTDITELRKSIIRNKSWLVQGKVALIIWKQILGDEYQVDPSRLFPQEYQNFNIYIPMQMMRLMLTYPNLNEQTTVMIDVSNFRTLKNAIRKPIGSPRDQTTTSVIPSGSKDFRTHIKNQCNTIVQDLLKKPIDENVLRSKEQLSKEVYILPLSGGLIKLQDDYADVIARRENPCLNHIAQQYRFLTKCLFESTSDRGVLGVNS